MSVWVFFFTLLLLKRCLFYWRPSVNGYCPSRCVIILSRVLKQSFPQNPYWLVIEDKIRSYKKFTLYDFKRVGSKFWCMLTEPSWKLMLLLFFHKRALCFNAEFKNVEFFSWNCTLSIFEIFPTPEYWKDLGCFGFFSVMLKFNENSELVGSGRTWYQVLEFSSLSTDI